MTSIALQFLTLAFVTDQNLPVPARRAFVRARYPGPLGAPVLYDTFIDTGAPYSIIPFQLAAQIRWNQVGTRTILSGRSRPIEWQGLPCVMGELQVVLEDPQTRVLTGSPRILAKIATLLAPPHLEKAAILGLNFLSDNSLRMELEGTPAAVTGRLWFP